MQTQIRCVNFSRLPTVGLICQQEYFSISLIAQLISLFIICKLIPKSKAQSHMKKENMVGQHVKTYTIIRVLGEGAWAIVYEAIDDRDSNTVAVKVIPQKLMRDTPKLQQLVKTEIKVLKSCTNDNVIRFVDSFKNDTNVFIVTEFCNSGDLQHYLQKKKNLSEDEATTFLKQILNGFKGLHEVGAMHRDFKVANVLIHNSVCKIADLGFAKQMEKKSLARTILGTSLTMAPQVLEQKPYGFQADIWSIGVVYYQMLYGKYPYMGMNDYDILKKIKNNRPDYSKVNLSKNAKDFIDRCLTIDPKKRISWVQIYSHDLISNKNQVGFIYGTLKSKISINQNKNFYQKNILPQKNIYPDLDNGNFKFDTKGVQFENVGDIRESSNMPALILQANLKREKEQAFQKCEKFYLHKRNDIMFIFKFISPFVTNFNHIKANHGIAMFILSKKAYTQMKKYYKELSERKNIFNLPKNFQEFTQTPNYKNITNQVKGDMEIIEAQCACYSADIENCSKQISNEFDVNKVASKDFDHLVKETVDQYWFLLADALSSTNNDRKRDLIRVLQALYYYKSSNRIHAQEFDHMMTIIDFNQAEKDIIKKYSSAFQ